MRRQSCLPSVSHIEKIPEARRTLHLKSNRSKDRAIIRQYCTKIVCALVSYWGENLGVLLTVMFKCAANFMETYKQRVAPAIFPAWSIKKNWSTYALFLLTTWSTKLDTVTPIATVTTVQNPQFPPSTDTHSIPSPQNGETKKGTNRIE